jgi:hypothetical protein
VFLRYAGEKDEIKEDVVLSYLSKALYIDIKFGSKGLPRACQDRGGERLYNKQLPRRVFCQRLAFCRFLHPLLKPEAATIVALAAIRSCRFRQSFLLDLILRFAKVCRSLVLVGGILFVLSRTSDHFFLQRSRLLVKRGSKSTIFVIARYRSLLPF